jgi:hypothetical protein
MSPLCPAATLAVGVQYTTRAGVGGVGVGWGVKEVGKFMLPACHVRRCTEGSRVEEPKDSLGMH